MSKRESNTTSKCNAKDDQVSFNTVTASGAWILFSKAVAQVLILIRTVILARLIGPKEFGILGIALLLIDITYTFSQTGMDFALIYRQTKDRCYLDSAWVLSIVRAMLVGCVLILIAPLVSLFFNEPRVTNVIRLVAFAKLIAGFKNIGIVNLQQDLDFRRLFYYESVVSLLDLIVVTALAFWLRNVWALAIGLLVTDTIRVGLSYVVHPYRPSWRVKWATIRELFDYGRWITIISIMQFVLNEGDDLLAGWLFGSQVLGVYQMAYKISNLPATQISYTIGRLTFPVYATLRNQEGKLSRAYLKTLRLTAMIAFPIAGGLGFLARPFVQGVLGQKWLSAVGLIQVLSIWGLTRAIWATVGPLYRAVGLPKLNVRLLSVRMLIQVILLWPMSQLWGIMGIALTVVISALLVFPINLYYIRNIINIEWRNIVDCLLAPGIGVCFIGIAIYGADRFFTFTSPLWECSVEGTLALVAFIIGFGAVDSLSGWESIGLLRRIGLRFNALFGKYAREIVEKLGHLKA